MPPLATSGNIGWALQPALLTLLIVGFPLSACAATPELVFGLPGEATVTGTQQVISGKLLIQGQMPITIQEPIRLSAMAAISKMCENKSSPIIADITQDAKTYGSAYPEFIVDYNLLPPLGGGHYCMESIAMMGYGNDQPPFDPAVGPPPFRALLQTEIKNNGRTYFMKIDDWKVALVNHTCSFKEVVSPVVRVSTEYTTTASPRGTLTPPVACEDGDPRMPPWVPPDRRPVILPPSSCSFANTACTCAALPNCTWATNDGGGTWCQSAVSVPNISCADCPAQNKCPLNPAAVCAAVSAPCLCAVAAVGCVWDVQSQSCVLNVAGAVTPCGACSAQAFCAKPNVVAVQPILNTNAPILVMGTAKTGWLVNVTFDRQIELTPWVTQVAELSCSTLKEFSPTLFDIGPDQVRIINNFFTLQVSLQGLRNDRLRECQVSIIGGAVRDRDHVPFDGMPGENLVVMLPDTIPPALSYFVPANSADGVMLNTSLRMVFTEPVTCTRKRGGANLTLTALGGRWRGGADGADVVVAQWNVNGTHVSFTPEANQMTVDFGDTLQPAVLYSLSVPFGALVDSTGNPYDGLLIGVYQFRTSALTVQEQLQGALKWGWYVLIAGGALVVALCLVTMIFAAIRLCCMHRKWQRGHRGPPQPLTNWVPEALEDPKAAAATKVEFGGAAGSFAPAKVLDTAMQPYVGRGTPVDALDIGARPTKALVLIKEWPARGGDGQARGPPMAAWEPPEQPGTVEAEPAERRSWTPETATSSPPSTAPWWNLGGQAGAQPAPAVVRLPETALW